MWAWLYRIEIPFLMSRWAKETSLDNLSRVQERSKETEEQGRRARIMREENHFQDAIRAFLERSA